MARVEVAGDKLKKSQISAEALYLTADLARADDMEKLVPTEVRGREMPRVNILREQRSRRLLKKGKCPR